VNFFLIDFVSHNSEKFLYCYKFLLRNTELRDVNSRNSVFFCFFHFLSHSSDFFSCNCEFISHKYQFLSCISEFISHNQNFEIKQIKFQIIFCSLKWFFSCLSILISILFIFLFNPNEQNKIQNNYNLLTQHIQQS